MLRPFTLISGLVSKVGVNITLVERSCCCTSMFSSKVNVTRLEWKFTLESAGSTCSSTGGIVSFGPPEGGIMFAQPWGKIVQNKAMQTEMTRMIPFFMQ